MAVNRSQYDASLVQECVSILRTNLAAIFDLHAVELTGTITLQEFQNAAIEAREEERLDDRGVLPQYPDGIHCRVISISEVPAQCQGEGRTIHRLEVITWVHSQSTESDSTLSQTASDGYVRCGYLARVVDDTLRTNLPGNNGVIYIEPVESERIVKLGKEQPSRHMVRTQYDVMQRTYRPFKQATAPTVEGLSMASWYLTTTGTTQVVASGVAEVLAVATTDGNEAGGLAHSTFGRITYTGTDNVVVAFDLTAAVSCNDNNTTFSLQVAKNGTVDAEWSMPRFVTTALDRGAIYTSGQVSCATDDFMEMWIEADNDTTITFHAASMTVEVVSE